jgi:hypothetical protein
MIYDEKNGPGQEGRMVFRKKSKMKKYAEMCSSQLQGRSGTEEFRDVGMILHQF